MRLYLDEPSRRIVRLSLKSAWASSSDEERRIIEKLLDRLKNWGAR